MKVNIRRYYNTDISSMIRIWNEIVEEGRCGHICNASYAVSSLSRGLHIGEKLVQDCLVQAKLHGFTILQFNAVVAGNTPARNLYERLGFKQLGTIPGGFRMKDEHFEDICPYYIVL